MGSSGQDGSQEPQTAEVRVESAESKVESDAIEGGKTWAGITFCYIIIGLIGLESLILIVYFFAATYSLESLGKELSADSVRMLKEARGAVVDDVLKVGNLFLGSVLLPILTLLLGYIYGSRARETGSEEGD